MAVRWSLASFIALLGATDVLRAGALESVRISARAEEAEVVRNIRIGRSLPLAVVGGASTVGTPSAREQSLLLTPVAVEDLCFTELDSRRERDAARWVGFVPPKADVLAGATFDPLVFGADPKQRQRISSNYSTTPEPASIYVASLGFAGLFVLRRRLRPRASLEVRNPSTRRIRRV